MPVNEKGLEAASEAFGAACYDYAKSCGKAADEPALHAAIQAYLRAASKDAEPVAAGFEQQLADGVISRLVSLTVGTCSCSTMSPELKYHADNCRYRVASEALELARPLFTHPSTGGDGGTHKLLNDIFHFLGGVDGAVELRARILTAIEPVAASPSLQKVQTSPDWILVPREPTNRMLMRAQTGQAARGFNPSDADELGNIFRAMLAATPASPEPSPASEDARARVETLERALRPFAEYMKDGHDLDNNGKPLPDSDGVGWVYLTIGDFRLARAALSRSTNGTEK